MHFDNVAILGLAHVDAPHRVPSADLERRLAPTLERLGMKPDLLSSLTGIVARRFWDEGTQPSQVATRAAELAIERAGVDRGRLGALLNTSVCRDFIEPSTACLVHGNLGLSDACLNFDVGNACLAFLSGIQIVGNMIERGQIESVKFGVPMRRGGKLALFARGAAVQGRACGELGIDKPFANVILDHATEQEVASGLQVTASGAAELVAFYTAP